MFATAPDGARLFWTSRGGRSKPTVVLIRGLARSHRYFEPLVPMLLERFHVLLFDNRGAGQSEHPEGPYDTAQMADDVVAVLDAAGVERAWLLGMSLGGMIAVEACWRHPRRVHGLILGSVTATGWGSPVRVPLWPKVLLTLSALLPKRPARRVQAWVTLSDAFVDQAEATMDRWDAIAAQEPFSIRALLAHLAAIRGHDSRPWLPLIQHPTLCLSARGDRLVPWQNGAWLADALPNGRFVLVEHCGHNIETERPTHMAALINDFVSQAHVRVPAHGF